MARLAEIQEKRLHPLISSTTPSETLRGRHEGCHGMGFDGRYWGGEWELTRHGRRHKSVGDPLSRVWEAMRRVLEVLTTGSRTHRSRYGNGCERQGLNVPPSVILRALQMMLSTRTELIPRKRHHKKSHDWSSFNFLFSLKCIVNSYTRSGYYFPSINSLLKLGRMKRH